MLKNIVAIVASAAIAASGAMMHHSTTGREYIREGIVSHVDHRADVVRVLDHDFDVWEFYGAEDWMPGDVCEMHMSDNGTPKYPYDDIILGVEYTGYMDIFE